ncbi:MAG: transglutaminase domain-containing protein [Chloroflexota bacterium]
MKFSARSALVFLLWLAALRTLASGLAIAVKGTTVGGYFPVIVFGFALGWAGKILSANLANRRIARMNKNEFAHSRHSRFNFFHVTVAWLIVLLLGATFVFIHNGRLAQPLGNVARAGARYEWQRVGSRFTRVTPDARELQSAQSDLADQWNDATSRVSALIQNLRAGESETDPLALQIVWSLAALALALWAGWNLRERRRALTAMLPSTLLLAYFQYYSEPDAYNFLFHILVLFLLIAVSEGSAPLRVGAAPRGISNDALMATFLVSVTIVVLAGITPSVSAKAIAQKAADELRERERREQNDAAAKALGLEPGPGEETIGQYAQPGLPREHLLQGSPQLSRTVVFTVRTGDLPPMPRLPRDERPPRYYWRTVVYDVYTGRGWAVTLNESRDEDPGELMIDAIPTGYRFLDYDLTFLSPSRLAWTGQLVRANQPLLTAWRSLPDSRERSLDPLRGADLIAATSDARAFHVESILPAFTVEQLRASSANYPDWVRDQYLALPSNLPARVRDLARELTADQPTAYDRAVSIERYLRRFPYTLNVPTPPADRDVADYFLFKLQTGYCDYYATAMVVLARAAGLPSRLVSGYASGEYVPSEAAYRVRETDAHSWVEIYFAGLGWVEFEPTANRPPITRAEAQAAAKDDTELPEIVPVTPPSRLNQFLRSLAALPWTNWFVVALLLAVLLIAIFAVRERTRQNSPLQSIAGIYKQIYRLGRGLLRDTTRVHTPFTFTRALQKRLEILPRSKLARDFLSPAKTELSALTELYVRAIYSPVPPTREETIYAMKIWRKLFWRLLALVSVSKVPPS